MAKINLTKTLSAIKGQLSNSAKDNVKRLIPDVEAVTDATFGAVLTPEIQEHLKALAKKVGVKYEGKTLDIWEGESSFGCRLPSIYSDGKKPVINWAGQVVELSGDVPGNFIGNELRIDNAKASLRIPVILQWENDAEKEEAEATLLDLETWEEVAALLRIRAEWLKREELFAGDIETITVMDAKLTEGPTGEYWAIVGDSGARVFKFSMPENASPKSGDVVTVDAEAKTLTLNGEVFESIHFVKLTELEVGKTYQAVQLKEKTGDYPGWTLMVPGVGLVDANSQIKRWIESTGVSPDEVSKEHPIEMTVISIKKGGNGRMVARLSLDLLKASAGLAALLGTPPAASSKIEKPFEDEDEDEDEDEEEKEEEETETPPLFEGANTTETTDEGDDDDWI